MNALDALYAALALVTAPVWARKTRSGWSERMGRLDPLPKPTRPRVLIHAVSVGEAAALRTLVPTLAHDHDVVVSCTTDTGLARARALYQDGPVRTATVVRYPLDFSGAVRRFLDAVRPDAVALTELELWPNFLAACAQRNIPAAVVNGRLSARSFANYRRFRPLVGPMFGRLTFAAVQDAAYAERFAEMGVPPTSIHTTGSMKWDNARITDEVPTATATATADADRLAGELGLVRTKPIIVAGSTGPGEEQLLHDAVAAHAPEAQLVCAPRKPERFDEAAAALPGCARRSARTPAPPGTTRFLLDSIGELSTLYAVADVVVIGRSFGDLYGSDPTEPIGLGRPTVIGPRTSDFDSIVAAFEAGGGIVRATPDDIGPVVRTLLDDPARRADLARAGRSVIRQHQGASERHAELIAALCQPPLGSTLAARA